MKQELRQKLRQARNSLSPQQQANAAQSLLRLFQESIFSESKRIALYIAADGEIDPEPICSFLWEQGAEVFLPKLSQNKMGFSPFRPDSNLSPNNYGISEPEEALSFGPKVLDLILMPLVGFDKEANRLGMGGGFYDRTLSTLQKKRPQLVGLAHECQLVDRIDAEEWDIPLDAVITNQKIYRFE